MAKITSFRDLEVWGHAMTLTERCYRATDSFPVSERYGLSSQIRRAAASIPANLAEGHGRSTRAFMNHVSIAIGSQAELDTLLELGSRLSLLPAAQREDIDENLRRTGQMLHALLRALTRSTAGTRKTDEAH